VEEAEDPENAEIHDAHVEEGPGAGTVLLQVLPQGMHAGNVEELAMAQNGLGLIGHKHT
jgi:hypothetical protein